jgi:hypothetical protein
MTKKRTDGSTYSSSEESSITEIGVAKAEGAAYGGALKYLTTVEASDSGERAVGDYIVAYSVEEAEGLYHFVNGRLEWHEAQQENCHLEIAVRNAADGRFVPYLSITATLQDENGSEIGTYLMPFLWHPWIYHYGRNWVIPHDGKYHLFIHIDPPQFSRHDRVNGHRFLESVEIRFEIDIKTGRKSSKAER